MGTLASDVAVLMMQERKFSSESIAIDVPLLFSLSYPTVVLVQRPRDEADRGTKSQSHGL
jgi:hypothetical protein